MLLKLLVAVTLLVSCTTTTTTPTTTATNPPATPAEAVCRYVVTPANVQNYFICLGPFAYCWIGEIQGISCLPRDPQDKQI